MLLSSDSLVHVEPVKKPLQGQGFMLTSHLGRKLQERRKALVTEYGGRT